MRKGMLYLAALVVVSYSVAPLVWQFLTSLKMDYELTRIPPLLPEAPSLAHYIAIFKGRMFLRIIANSALVASCTTILALAVGSLCSFGLAKLEIRYKALILGSQEIGRAHV